MFLQAEEDFEFHSDRKGCWGLRSEVRDGLTLYDTFLVVQGKDDLCGMLKVLDSGIIGDDMVPNEEQESQEGTELDCTVVSCAIGVFIGPEAEI